jgi:hypothetical protein
MLLPALNKAREKAKQGSCMSNLKQWGTALTMYADSYDGWYPADPTIPASRAWPTLPRLAPFDPLLECGITRALCYCPSYSLKNTDSNWTLPIGSSTFRYLGYSLFCLFPASVGTHYPTDADGKSILPTRVSSSKGSWVIAADAMRQYTNGNWVKDEANHRMGTDPEGGNSLHVDGHVKWLPFNNIDRSANYWQCGENFYGWEK